MGINKHKSRSSCIIYIKEYSNYNKECSICLVYILHTKKNVLDCGHTFHMKCINEWKKFSQTCPICRKDIIDMPCLDNKNWCEYLLEFFFPC